MRVLIQKKDSGLYLQDGDAWARRSLDAKDFLSSTAAIDFCMEHKIGGVQLVLKFDEQRYDIVMPLTPQAGSASTAALQSSTNARSARF